MTLRATSSRSSALVILRTAQIPSKAWAIASTSVGPNAVFSSRRWISMTISPNERLMPDYAAQKSLLEKSDPPARGGRGRPGVTRVRGGIGLTFLKLAAPPAAAIVHRFTCAALLNICQAYSFLWTPALMLLKNWAHDQRGDRPNLLCNDRTVGSACRCLGD